MEHAKRVLEFPAIRERLAHHTQTELGRQRALAMEPVIVPDEVWRLLEQTRQAHELLGDHAPPSLGACHDLRQPLRKAEKGGTLGGQELFQIGDAMAAMRSMRTFLQPRRESAPDLWSLAEPLPEQRSVESALLDSLEPNGDLRDDASPELKLLRQKIKSTQSRVHERIQSYLGGRMREYLSDPIFTQRDGRYVIPVRSEHRGKVRGVVHDTSATGQTIFVEPDDVLQLSNQLREIQSAERDECQKILGRLSRKVGAVAPEVSAGLELAAELDLLFGKAKLAYAMRAILPFARTGHGVRIRGARHPLLEETLGDSIVPIDLEVGFERKGLLITGPNTGGKTVAIKTVGLFAMMAQCGLFLPAQHVDFGPFTQVWADIGDEQSIQQSLSTFSAHIRNISTAMNSLKPGSLSLFDEIGAGTDPAEGAALAKAILSTFTAKGAIVLASTHYGELKAFAYEQEGFTNAAMEFDAKSLRPTYRVLMGAPGASHALKIAERYGIPKSVVELARQNLDQSERDVSRLLEQLEQAQRQARIAQSEADKRLAELRRSEERTKRKLEEADEIRRSAHARANEVIEGALREIRLEAQRLFEEVKTAPNTKAREQAREGLKELQRVGSEFADQFKVKSKSKASDPGIVRGASVKAEGFSQVGTVLTDPRGGRVEVQMGALKMSFPVSQLTLAGRADLKPVAKPSVRLQKAQTASPEIHLRAMRAEDAEEELRKFLDESVLAGLHQVRIVHGKGEGILRKMTWDILRRYPDIAEFREGEPGEGGAGVTIAVFR